MDNGQVTVKFDAAIIGKFTTKPGKIDGTVGQIQIDVESQNPFMDFASMHRFRPGIYVTVTIESQVGTGGD